MAGILGKRVFYSKGKKGAKPSPSTGKSDGGKGSATSGQGRRGSRKRENMKKGGKNSALTIRDRFRNTWGV